MATKRALTSRIPSASAYLRVLRSLEPVSKTHRRMLCLHTLQPGRTITTAKLARGMGYENYRPVNLHYGALARLVGDKLGWKADYGDPDRVGVLVTFGRSGGQWTWILRPQVVSALEKLRWPKIQFDLMPGEMPNDVALTEGAVRHVAVTAYERNPTARAKCLQHYGPFCVACDMNFADTYGELAEGFMHVHHLRLLSDVGKRYTVDPIRDLRPVCPNCHAVIHMETKPLDLAKLRGMIRQNKKRSPPSMFAKSSAKSP